MVHVAYCSIFCSVCQRQWLLKGSLQNMVRSSTVDQMLQNEPLLIRKEKWLHQPPSCSFRSTAECLCQQKKKEDRF